MAHPTEAEIRAALLARVDLYSRLTGTPISQIGWQAVNDRSFITDVRAGHNFTVERYQRAHDWLDENWPGYDDKPKQTGRKRANGTRSKLSRGQG